MEFWNNGILEKCNGRNLAFNDSNWLWETADIQELISSIFNCAAVILTTDLTSAFQHSTIPLFHSSIIPLFQHSNIPARFPSPPH
ncbi:MAG: hypothetical protein C5B50_18285 [Verrucomicrobia bacterium]|nr:MAG: hypothetical protein C5B50_18285 [Verrucomicrobiota bacterium]